MTTYSYTTLSDPSAAPGAVFGTVPVSINNRGQVVGFYSNGTANVGFLYSNGTYTTLSDPLAAGLAYTLPQSINERGQVVGYYWNGTADIGFLYHNGTWTNLSDPSAGVGGYTLATSVNDMGEVAGYYYKNPSNPLGSPTGFLYSNGTYTDLNDPSAGVGGATLPLSINDRGQVAGYTFTNGTGFIYTNGTWTTLRDPSEGGTFYTLPLSINDSGQVTGYYSTDTGEAGFLYSSGTYTTLSDPSAGPNGSTLPASINDRGQITGVAYGKGGQVGFVYSNGIWTTLSDPSAGPGGTNGVSINDRGQITGSYSTNGTTALGFIATPTDVDHKREPPKLMITDHSLSLSAGGTIPLPISVSPNDADDTATVKISGVPSFDTITALDGHAAAKKGNSYTFTAADVQSGLTLTSSVDNHADHEGRHDEHRIAAEQSKLTVTAFNTAAGEHAATKPQTITVTNTPNDLSYLMQLLNELQPKFLELITAHSRGGPTINMETYGPQHVTAEFPPIEVTAPNGDPTTVSFSADPYGYLLNGPSGEVPNDVNHGIVPTSQLPNLTYIPPAGAGHNAQLEVTKVTVIATDTVTGKSTSTFFDFIGFGQDKTLPPNSFPANPNDSVIIPQGEVFNHFEQLLQSGNLNPGQSFQSLAALITQYAAGFHNEHEGVGQITSLPDKQGHQENLAFFSNPHNHG